MKKSVRIVVLLFVLCSAVLPSGASGGRKAMKNSPATGLRYLESSFHLYDSLQKRIWNYAETAYNEHKSAEQWASFLEGEGFKVERGVAGIPTAFVASYGEGSPVIGMMAEYDALAGMSQDTVAYRKPLVEGANGHGCGHNLLGAGVFAAALGVKRYLETHPGKGTVRLYGCPGEEAAASKGGLCEDTAAPGDPGGICP